MLERLGETNIFYSADLTQAHFQMQSFIKYRGLYKWTRVPMGIFFPERFILTYYAGENLGRIVV